MIDNKAENNHEHPVLANALALCVPLASWLIRHGIGHAQFAARLKNVFFVAAEKELKKQGLKETDSSISLISGLHRKDVKNIKNNTQKSIFIGGASKPSLPNQIFTRWLSGPEKPESLPINGASSSFEQLASSVSKDVHHRAMLQELVRLGLVKIDGESVSLLQHAFVPHRDQIEAWQMMVQSVADHLTAGIHNLTSEEKTRHLEQSVFIDGLSPQSAQELGQLANDIWRDALQRMVQAATPLCEQGPGSQEYRFRLGIFSFSESIQTHSYQDSK
jgi:hypothetical protein